MGRMSWWWHGLCNAIICRVASFPVQNLLQSILNIMIFDHGTKAIRCQQCTASVIALSLTDNNALCSTSFA